ncbi:MAG: metallophosphoesterase [Candidatus Poribacteria bacterium]|nr:metallophosphoesterase [Candidatus Poribacteria bacterium]
MYHTYKHRKLTCFAGIATALIFSLAIVTIGTTQTPTAAEHLQTPEGMPIVERPVSTDPDKFSFAIIGDKTGGGYDKWHIFDRAVDEINVLKPDFSIMVGDLIQGYTYDVAQVEAEWKEFWQHQSDLMIPFLLLPGNHDITNPMMYDYWQKHLGRTYSAFIYKGCLFILLNTEEKHSQPEGSEGWTETWFGDAQVTYVTDQLAKHKNVRHTFVMLHKPAWLHDNSGWSQIEEALADQAYTVFAGHYHNLTLHTRNDRRYFVLGATGGGFTTQEAREVGAFDHYSIVTVDGSEINIAIVEPGNIYPADLSTAEFKEKLRDLITLQTRLKIERVLPTSGGKLEIALKNELEKEIKVDLVFHSSENWQAAPNELTFTLKPGQDATGNVLLSALSEALLPLPIYEYSALYGGEQLYRRTEMVYPVNPSVMHLITDWALLGPFKLDVTEEIAALDVFPPDFIANPLPTYDKSADKTYQGKHREIQWQEHHVESGRVDLEKVFNKPEWASAYGVTYIKSPDVQQVFAQIRWWSNLGRLFINGVEINLAAAPGEHLFYGRAYVELPLKAGWNIVTVHSGDYTGGWSYQMAVDNTKNMLEFSTNPD